MSSKHIQAEADSSMRQISYQSLAVGLCIGGLMCMTNMYFGAFSSEARVSIRTCTCGNSRQAGMELERVPRHCRVSLQTCAVQGSRPCDSKEVSQLTKMPKNLLYFNPVMTAGLQTGWVTMGSLQSAILGFGIFQFFKKQGWVSGFSIAENVIVQTCAVASATMPLAAGFVGVIPAMKHLTVEENPPDGPYEFSTLQLILWSTALAFFGVFVAVPLRTQVIEREQLRFPSGTATAQIIKTLHETHGTDGAPVGLEANPSIASLIQCPSRVSYNSHVPFGFRIGSSRCSIERPYKRTTADIILSTALSAALDEESLSQVLFNIRPWCAGKARWRCMQGQAPATPGSLGENWEADTSPRVPVTPASARKSDTGGINVASIDTTWSALGMSFCFSFAASGAVAVIEIYNRLQNASVPTTVPIFGSAAAIYGWKLGANVGYIGQGMIMGPRVCISMLAGAIIGFGVLAPMAVRRGWASDSQSSPDGSVAWVSWVAMSVMIAESLTSLAILLCRYVAGTLRAQAAQSTVPLGTALPVMSSETASQGDTVFVAAAEPASNCEPVPENCATEPTLPASQQAPQDPHQQRVPTWAWLTGLLVSLCAATGVIGDLFPMPYWQVTVAMCLAMLVAVLAVRALGETDLNPVSGIGKLAQVAFAVLAPGHVVPNLVAGAISEAAAAQAGDMMQDFKTAAILGVCPKCQFVAALIGSMASCWFSTAAYALFSHVYVIGGEKLPAPTAAIWIDMARLVTGGDLPPHVEIYCWIGACVGVILALMPDVIDATRSMRYFAQAGSNSPANRIISLVEWLWPSGIGLAIGAYILPQCVLPRVVGALLAMPSVWTRCAPAHHQGSMLVVASGLVLGEGIASMVFTILKSVV